MDSQQILIINPLDSNLKSQLIETISSLPYVGYLLIKKERLNTYESNIDPDLIIVLLDKCKFTNIDYSKMENLQNIFPLTPIICFINTSNSKCLRCLKCKNFSWTFIHTPIYEEDVLFIIKWYLRENDTDDTQIIEKSLKEHSLMDLFIGNSKSAIRIKNRIQNIAPIDVTVLIQGETGTGKELCAKLLHYLSKRSEENFAVINCGAIPKNLFENELFGHKKGAYTHAETSENGIIYSANHGTLFLDEIESLPKSSQVKLLRFLEEKKYKPLGQSKFVKSDVRIIIASNCNLEDLVKRGKFRDDLYYRLSVVNIDLPPLSKRKEDIHPLTKYFIEKYSKLYNKNIIGLKPDAIMYLNLYSWPGNIRELENMIQEAVIFNSTDWIELENLNFSKFANTKKPKLDSFQRTKKEAINNFEEEYINTVLKLFEGNITQASVFAKKDRREFYRLIKKHKIEPRKFRLIKE